MCVVSHFCAQFDDSAKINHWLFTPSDFRFDIINTHTHTHGYRETLTRSLAQTYFIRPKRTQFACACACVLAEINWNLFANKWILYGSHPVHICGPFLYSFVMETSISNLKHLHIVAKRASRFDALEKVNWRPLLSAKNHRKNKRKRNDIRKDEQKKVLKQ